MPRGTCILLSQLVVPVVAIGLYTWSKTLQNDLPTEASVSRRDTVKSGRIEVLNKLGLHARAAAQVVRIASGFESEISLHNVNQTANAKGIMGLMMLSATQGTSLLLEVEGADENSAYEAIQQIFETRFGEEEVVFTLQGSGVGKGIAIGTAYVMERSATYVPSKPVERAKLGAEIALLDLALKRASDSLIKAMEVVPKDAPKEITAFLDAHMLMVEDPTLREATVEIMQKHSYSAETALMIHRNQLVEVFDAMEDEYLRSKKNDVDQVIQQIHHQLLALDGEREVQRTVELEGRILVAHDLTPADTVLFMKMKMRAFVTNLGSPISHVAILARSLQIPAVVGLHVAIKHIEHGTTIAVDSTDGTVIVDPDENTLAELKARQQEYEDHHQELLALRDLEPPYAGWTRHFTAGQCRIANRNRTSTGFRRDWSWFVQNRISLHESKSSTN